MKNFYTETFSAKAGNLYTNPSTGFSSYFLSFGTGARIEIMHKPGHNFSPSENHFAIAAGSRKNVDKITARLLKQGEATMVSWPRKTGDGYYETIFKDPEGNLFEITI
ncbi:MAG: VOC family protein [Bacteroidales bacterium]|nr:VOC family protein [Bacteroidales bacterium]